MQRGKFIVLDGMDGTGKGTQVKLLAGHLFDCEKRNHIFLTREPYISEFHDEIRRILKESVNPRDHAEELTELFVKDRRVHAEIIGSLLTKGILVISDRYKYSTLAYQQTQGASLQKLIALHKDILIPDLVLIIDAPTEIVLWRIDGDQERKHKEIFEQKDFQEKLRENFLELPWHLPEEKIVVIDGAGFVDEVASAVRKEVDKLF